MTCFARYGNCLLCALLLMIRNPGSKLHYVTYSGQIVPHFYVTFRNGESWHYRRIIDILPYPLYYLVFVGRFRQMNRKDLTS